MMDSEDRAYLQCTDSSDDEVNLNVISEEERELWKPPARTISPNCIVTISKQCVDNHLDVNATNKNNTKLSRRQKKKKRKLNSCPKLSPNLQLSGSSSNQSFYDVEGYSNAQSTTNLLNRFPNSNVIETQESTCSSTPSYILARQTESTAQELEIASDRKSDSALDEYFNAEDKSLETEFTVVVNKKRRKKLKQGVSHQISNTLGSQIIHTNLPKVTTTSSTKNPTQITKEVTNICENLSALSLTQRKIDDTTNSGETKNCLNMPDARDNLLTDEKKNFSNDMSLTLKNNENTQPTQLQGYEEKISLQVGNANGKFAVNNTFATASKNFEVQKTTTKSPNDECDEGVRGEWEYTTERVNSVETANTFQQNKKSPKTAPKDVQKSINNTLETPITSPNKNQETNKTCDKPNFNDTVNFTIESQNIYPSANSNSTIKKSNMTISITDANLIAKIRKSLEARNLIPPKNNSQHIRITGVNFESGLFGNAMQILGAQTVLENSKSRRQNKNSVSTEMNSKANSTDGAKTNVGAQNTAAAKNCQKTNNCVPKLELNTSEYRSKILEIQNSKEPNLKCESKISSSPLNITDNAKNTIDTENTSSTKNISQPNKKHSPKTELKANNKVPKIVQANKPTPAKSQQFNKNSEKIISKTESNSVENVKKNLPVPNIHASNNSQQNLKTNKLVVKTGPMPINKVEKTSEEPRNSGSLTIQPKNKKSVKTSLESEINSTTNGKKMLDSQNQVENAISSQANLKSSKPINRVEKIGEVSRNSGSLIMTHKNQKSDKVLPENETNLTANEKNMLDSQDQAANAVSAQANVKSSKPIDKMEKISKEPKKSGSLNNQKINKKSDMASPANDINSTANGKEMLDSQDQVANAVISQAILKSSKPINKMEKISKEPRNSGNLINPQKNKKSDLASPEKEINSTAHGKKMLDSQDQVANTVSSQANLKSGKPINKMKKISEVTRNSGSLINPQKNKRASLGNEINSTANGKKMLDSQNDATNVVSLQANLKTSKPTLNSEGIPIDKDRNISARLNTSTVNNSPETTEKACKMVQKTDRQLFDDLVHSEDTQKMVVLKVANTNTCRDVKNEVILETTELVKTKPTSILNDTTSKGRKFKGDESGDHTNLSGKDSKKKQGSPAKELTEKINTKKTMKIYPRQQSPIIHDHEMSTSGTQTVNFTSKVDPVSKVEQIDTSTEFTPKFSNENVHQSDSTRKKKGKNITGSVDAEDSKPLQSSAKNETDMVVKNLQLEDSTDVGPEEEISLQTCNAAAATTSPLTKQKKVRKRKKRKSVPNTELAAAIKDLENPPCMCLHMQSEDDLSEVCALLKYTTVTVDRFIRDSMYNSMAPLPRSRRAFDEYYNRIVASTIAKQIKQTFDYAYPNNLPSPTKIYMTDFPENFPKITAEQFVIMASELTSFVLLFFPCPFHTKSSSHLAS